MCLLIYLLLLLSATANGLKCYTCSATQSDIDQRCITDPETVQGNGITNCNKNYCTSTRVEYLDPKGKIQSMNRDCVDTPIYKNQILEDSTYRIYYIACQKDLCNGGSGKDISKGLGLIHDDGENIVLYVPGIGVDTNASSTFLQESNFLLVLIITAIIYISFNI